MPAYEEFLRDHPDSEFDAAARAGLEDLSADRDFRFARTADSVAAYEQFLGQHSLSRFAADARVRLQALYAQREWKAARSADTIEAYERSLAAHPTSPEAAEARSRLALLRECLSLWEGTEAAGSIPAYVRFLEEHPDCPNAEEARRRIADHRRDQTGWEIVDAVERNRVTVETAGSGIETVTLRIKRIVHGPITVIIRPGTFFVARGGAQNMVGRREGRIELRDDGWHAITVEAACANKERAIPDSDERFEVQRSPHQDELKPLMPVLARAGVSFDVEQAAVWIVTDDADYEGLGTLVSGFGGFGPRIIDETDAARAMKLIDDAGIDIRTKAIWRDRDLILKGVKDAQLRSWLQSKHW